MGCKLYSYQGEMLTIAEISRRCGENERTIRARLNRGLTLEAATSPRGRTSKRYPYRGEMLTMAEIAAQSGTAESTIRRRMTEYGLSADEAAESDGSSWGAKYTYKGQPMTLARIAQATGISRNTLITRLNLGWTMEEATTRPTNPKPSQSTTITVIPPPEDVPPEEREQRIAAQKIAQTVTSLNLCDWHFREVMPGVYAFDGTQVAWQIVFGHGNQAHLKAYWKKTGESMHYDRAFEVDGARVKEAAKEWWP